MCVCVYPTAVGRTVPVPGKWVRVARWDSGMAVPMKCFCSTFLQHLREPTRPSQDEFPGFSAPFSAPLRRHYMAFRLHRSLYRSHEHRRLHLRNLLHRRHKHRRVHLGSYTAATTTLTLGLATVADLASLICGAEQLKTQSQRSCYTRRCAEHERYASV